MISRIFRLHFALYVGLFLSFPSFSQTLTISSAGNSGTYSFSAGTLTVNANSTITAATIVSWLSSSSLTIVGNTNAISVNVNENIVSNVAGNGLTIGNSNSIGTVTFNNTVNLMGALTVYADKINLGSTLVENGQSAQLIAGGSSGSISLLARNGFETLATGGTTRGKIMATGGGNIQINADTQNDNTGQLNIDWLTFDCGTGNIILEGSTYVWETGTSVSLPEFYGTGTLTVRNVPNAIYSFSTSWVAIFGNFTGLTIGRNDGLENNYIQGCTVCDSQAKNYYLGASFQIAGPINLYGKNAYVELNIKSTASNADILFKAKNSIIVTASKSIISNNGDITFWANADGTANSTDGDFIGIYNAVVINSANGSTSQSSGGGTITMAGGTTTQTLSSGTLVPTDYAYSNRTTNWFGLPPGGINFGANTAANGQVNSLSIYSGGGDIVIKGKSNSSSAGIQWFSGSAGATQIMNSGNGTILFDGFGTSTDAHGIELNSYANTVYPTITSSSSSSSAIKFVGVTSATTNRAGFQGAAILIADATGGGIEISGKTTGTNTYGAVEAGSIQTYALTGPITFIGEGIGGLKIGGTWGKGSLSSSGSNIVIRSNVFTLSNPTIQTSGTITVEPLGTSFTNALSFPITNLNLPNTITGLTLGKSTNTSDVTIGSETTISGLISIYGGNISLNQNLITSGGGVNGDVLVKASGNIVQATTKNITTSGGDVTLWSDSDANGAGYIYISGGAASGVFSGGGNVFFGGGTDLSTGYARGSDELDGVVAEVRRGGIQLCSGSALQSGGGNITLRGQNSGLSTQWVHPGIMGIGTTIDAGNGKVALIGKATGSGSANAQAISREGNVNWIIKSSNPYPDAIKLIGDASGCNGSATSLGINFIGTIEANGGGGILLHGTSGTGTGYDHGLDVRGNILANSGTITLKGENNLASDVSVLLGTYSTFSTTLGFKASTNVTASTSPIIIQGDNIYLEAVAPVNTTGSLTIEPVNTSFSSALSFPIANLTVASTIGGLTLGKSGNTKDITIGAATSVAGPINLYGNALILSGALSTTNLTTGNMSLNGTTLSGGSLAVANGRTLTMNLSSNTNYTGTITGTGLNFVKNGTGILKLPTPSALSFAAMTISGGGFILNPNQQLTLSGLLTSNGTFTMKDGATFLQKTSGTSIEGTGTFKVEKLLTGNSSSGWSNTNGRFWYMGVPMVNVARNSYGTYGASTNQLWSYAESTKSYTELTSGTASLSAGTGYVHRRSTNDTLIFSAIGADGLYRSDASMSALTKTAGNTAGVHLVSNPYMAFLDWHSVTKTNVDATYYIRTNNTNNISAIISYNQSTGEATNNSSVSVTAAQLRYIAPMQSIWVRVLGNAGSTGSLAMSRSMLSPQSGNVGLKSSTVFPTKARVNLVDGDRFDQMLVYLNGDMSNEVDEYDSEKMAASGTAQIYTMSSNKKLVMNGLKNNKKKVSVPLYLELPETKSYTLQLSEYMVEDGLILLEDKQEGTMQDFTLMENYTFYANSGLLQNRFVLHFILPNAELAPQGPSNSWVAEEGSYTEGGDVEIANDNKGNIEITLNQAVDQKAEGTVFVTDMNGKEVYTGQLEGIITAIELDVPSGIYYLTVQSGTLIEKKKVFVQD